MRAGSRVCALWSLAVFCAGMASGSAAGSAQVSAVASFSILADMVGQIGGERVAVVPLVGAGGDAHVFRASPADVRRIAGADILFVNGLGFEGWLDRLVEVSGYDGPVIVASAGVDALAAEPEDGHDGDDGGLPAEVGGHAHLGYDSHAWLSPVNARVYAGNIAGALTRLDPPGGEVYSANLARYLEEIAEVDREARAVVAAIPAARRVLITSHDAFGYFADEYGIEFLAPVGRVTGSEASAADLAAIIRQIRARDVSVVFLGSISNPRLLRQISRETGARLGGKLYSDTLSGPDGPASSYLEMMRHNIRQIAEGLAP